MPVPKKTSAETLSLRITVIDPPPNILWALQLGRDDLVKSTLNTKDRISSTLTSRWSRILPRQDSLFAAQQFRVVLASAPYICASAPTQVRQAPPLVGAPRLGSKG